MAVHLLGNTNVAVFKSRNGRTARFWAENGVIHIEDYNERAVSGDKHTYSQISVRDALLRVKGINDMLGKSSDQGVEIDPQERASLQAFVTDIIEVIRRAREQGTPHERLKSAGIVNIADVPELSRPRRTVQVPLHYFQ